VKSLCFKRKETERARAGAYKQERFQSKESQNNPFKRNRTERTEQNYHTGTRREAVKESHAKPPTGRNKNSFCCD